MIKLHTCALFQLIFVTLFSIPDIHSFVIQACRFSSRVQKFPSAIGTSTIVSLRDRQSVSDRIQKLRDVSVQKEILKDLTASEFAIRLEVNQQNSKIDYNMLIAMLDHDINLLAKQKHEKSESLLERVRRTKFDLIRVRDIRASSPVDTQVDSSSTQSAESSQSDVVRRSKEIQNEEEDIEAGPPSSPPAKEKRRLESLKQNLKLIVREDGTVDWDEARASGREVAKFGTELWERINGKEEGLPTFPELFNQMQSRVVDTDEIKKLTEIVQIAQNDFNLVNNMKNQVKLRLREIRRSGESVPLGDIDQLQMLELRCKEVEKRLKLVTLNLDIERICVYLQTEIESSVVSANPFDQRILIANIALIDKQLSSILYGLRLNISTPATFTATESSYNVSKAMHICSEGNDSFAPPLVCTEHRPEILIANTAVSQSYFYTANTATDDLISLIDDDELTLICNEVAEMKGQLGLGPQTGGIMDWGSLGVLVSDSISKIKQGVSFYGEGTKILLNDLQYAWLLFTKAIQGYTLKPREVNSLRRTGKDLLTLIPFTIILIIPLSPVGHVLVFSFIQRFFPDFFPSCYTEKRLNLGKLLSEIERKNVVDDLIGNDEPTPFRLPTLPWPKDLRSIWNEFTAGVNISKEKVV